MDETIIIPRTSIEAFLQAATAVLDGTEASAPDNLERTEIVIESNKRKLLKEAVYQAERAIFENDKALTAEKMSHNARKRHEYEDFSEDKMNWIEGKR